MCLIDIEEIRTTRKYVYKVFEDVDDNTLTTPYAGQLIRKDTSKWQKPDDNPLLGVDYTGFHVGKFSVFFNKSDAIKCAVFRAGKVWKVEIKDKKIIKGTFWFSSCALVSTFRLVKEVKNEKL